MVTEIKSPSNNLNPKPYTLNPKPYTLNPIGAFLGGFSGSGFRGLRSRGQARAEGSRH